MEQQDPHASVVSVQDVATYDPTKGTVRAKRVNIQFWDGSMSYVVIPEDQYTANRVQQELMSAAIKHHNVLQVRVSRSDAEMQAQVGTNQPNPWQPKS